MQRSSQYLMVKIELPILQLKQNSNNINEEEVTIFCSCALQVEHRLSNLTLAALLPTRNTSEPSLTQCILENLRCGTHFIELSNEIKSKTLTFNEDLKLRPWWTPAQDKNYLLGQYSPFKLHHCKNFVHIVPLCYPRFF